MTHVAALRRRSEARRSETMKRCVGRGMAKRDVIARVCAMRGVAKASVDGVWRMRIHRSPRDDAREGHVDDERDGASRSLGVSWSRECAGRVALTHRGATRYTRVNYARVVVCVLLS